MGSWQWGKGTGQWPILIFFAVGKLSKKLSFCQKKRPSKMLNSRLKISTLGKFRDKIVVFSFHNHHVGNLQPSVGILSYNFAVSGENVQLTSCFAYTFFNTRRR